MRTISCQSSAFMSTSRALSCAALYCSSSCSNLVAVHAHDHIGEHLDKAAIGVVGKARIAGFVGQALGDFVVEAQVEDGVHHARHGDRRAGAHREQQRVLGVAKTRAHLFLDQIQGDPVFLLQQGGQFVACLEKLAAGAGGDNEAEGHGQAQVGHFAQVGALAAEQVPVVLAALVEQVYALCHAMDFR